MHLSEQQKSRLLTLTHSKIITNIHLIQAVWGGYGQLFRVKLAGGEISSLVLKIINIPQPDKHPKGWNSQLAHQRKLFSYQVESYWYTHYAPQFNHQDCPMPHCLFVEKNEQQLYLVLEDLSDVGYPVVKKHCTFNEAQKCISWLAQFHARHLNHDAKGLWPTGSYWHLETRPEELHNLQDSALKEAATKLDKALKDCPFQTIIHGDAKLANFCFSVSGDRVAALDFQYVGKGCGMKDLILFISSAVKPNRCDQQAPLLVEHYFKALHEALSQSEIDATELEAAWRPLYSIAWADFQRFVKGWSPEHWKINPYTESLTRKALGELDAIINTAT